MVPPTCFACRLEGVISEITVEGSAWSCPEGHAGTYEVLPAQKPDPNRASQRGRIGGRQAYQRKVAGQRRRRAMRKGE